MAWIARSKIGQKMSSKIVDQNDRLRKIALFGHFGAGNFGNEATLQTMLTWIRQSIPKAQLLCISSFPDEVSAMYKIDAFPICEVVSRPWKNRGPIAGLVRKLLVGVPSEFYRCWRSIRQLWGTDLFMIVGTGLLTDAYGLGGWGPYSLFRWTLLAKLCGCRIVIASAGAGPINRPLGKLLFRTALSLADFRSFRDEASLKCIEGIGIRHRGDRIYPDLAFSLPMHMERESNGSRPIVGLGVIEHHGIYGSVELNSDDYARYIETLAQFAAWLLARGYDIQLLIGDFNDVPALAQLTSLIRERVGDVAGKRVRGTPAQSAAEVMHQLGETDVVVATRFHNVLLALVLNKPSISISFHHKCSSLMDQMGLSEYCQDIQQLSVEKLIDKFCRMEENAPKLKQIIRERNEEHRRALDDQYRRIFQELGVEPFSAYPPEPVISRVQ
jgi:polysaccharide pyruvyl transferase WcaK-like protein